LAIDSADEAVGQAGRRTVAYMYAIVIEQQNRAEHPRTLRFDDPQQKTQCLVHRSAFGNTLQNLILAF
jgi:hypothetical protein